MRVLESQILVIGAGAAGLRAAVEASTLGTDVAVLHKGSLANCTCWADKTYEIVGGGGCGFAAPTVPPDSPEKYYEDLSRIAGNRNVTQLTALFAEQSGKAFSYLLSNGVGFTQDKDGRPVAAPEIWHSFPRIHYSKHGTGKEIVHVLKAKAVSSGVKILEDFHVFRLLVRDGEIAGCLAFSKASQETVSIRCNAVVLATGGAGRVFQHTTNPAGMTGDGISLAWEAGADLINMDLYSDIPMSLKPVYGIGLVPQLLFAGVDIGVEELLKSPKIMWKYNPSKLSPEKFQALFPETFHYIKTSGIDLSSETIELHWMAHFMLGGVKINTKAETSVRGLYAAGEVAGGITGINRLPGTGIAEGLVFGEIAGRNAAIYAEKSESGGAGKNALTDETIKTKALSSKAFQDLQEIKHVLAELAYKALRDKKDSQVKSIADEIETLWKECNSLLDSDYTDFIPSSSQFRMISDLKSMFTYSRLYLKEKVSLIA